jgi:hypothetical protein
MVVSGDAASEALKTRVAEVGDELDKLHGQVNSLQAELHSVEAEMGDMPVFVGIRAGLPLSNSRLSPRFELAPELTVELERIECCITFLAEVGHVDLSVNGRNFSLAESARQTVSVGQSRTYSGVGMAYQRPLQPHNFHVDTELVLGMSQGGGTTGPYGSAVLRGVWVVKRLLFSLGIRADYFRSLPNGDSSDTVDTLIPSIELRFMAQVRGLTL